MKNRKLGKRITREEGTFSAYACQYNCTYCYCSCDMSNCGPTGSTEASGRFRESYVNDSTNDMNLSFLTMLG